MSNRNSVLLFDIPANFILINRKWGKHACVERESKELCKEFRDNNVTPLGFLSILNGVYIELITRGLQDMFQRTTSSTYVPLIPQKRPVLFCKTYNADYSFQLLMFKSCRRWKSRVPFHRSPESHSPYGDFKSCRHWCGCSPISGNGFRMNISFSSVIWHCK